LKWNPTMGASWRGCRYHAHIRGRSRPVLVRFLQLEPTNWHLRHISGNIACSGWRCSKGSMDDADSHGYRFDNASMTESYGVEPGPLPLPVHRGLAGKEPN
jgi:hypothetical protein